MPVGTDKPTLTVTYHAEWWEFSAPAPDTTDITIEVVKNADKTAMTTVEGDRISFHDRRGTIVYRIVGWNAHNASLECQLVGDYRVLSESTDG